MPNATIKRVWIEGRIVNGAFAVVEGSRNVEYIASLSIDDKLDDYGYPGETFMTIPDSSKKEVLRLAVQKVRDKFVSQQTNLGTISGTVTV